MKMDIMVGAAVIFLIVWSVGTEINLMATKRRIVKQFEQEISHRLEDIRQASEQVRQCVSEYNRAVADFKETLKEIVSNENRAD